MLNGVWGGAIPYQTFTRGAYKLEVSKAVYKLMEDELMRLLFSESNDLTYIYDTKGNILFANKIFEKFTGCRPEEYYGKPFISLFKEYNLEKAMNAFTSTLKGQATQCEVCFGVTDVLCEHKSFPLRDEKRNIIGVMGIARDITTRKHREEKIKLLNESLEKRVSENSARLMEVNKELMEEINVRKQLEEEFKRGIEKFRNSWKGVMQTLALSAESKDLYSVGHQKRVANIACCIAREMALSKEKVEGVYLAALLHDIGKVSIPTEILCKQGKLTKAEYDMIKVHPKMGYEILNEVEFSYPIAKIVLQHHEKIDGSGYPMGLTDEEILLEAKIIAVADVLEAMSSHRAYRPSLGLDKALEEISNNKGVLYDGEVADACLVAFIEKGFRFEQRDNSNIKLLDDVLLKV